MQSQSEASIRGGRDGNRVGGVTLRLAVLVSGQGRTFLNLLNEIDEGNLNVSIHALISSRRTTPALDEAIKRGISSHFVSFKSLGHEKAIETIYDHCRGADCMVMAGFLKHFFVRPEWEGRIVNIHPSLLPKYGGKGFYGDRVHAAVLEAKEQETGCSVHLVDNEYDHGPVLDRVIVPVDAADTVESLAKRVFEQEKILYPRVLSRIASGEWALPLSQKTFV